MRKKKVIRNVLLLAMIGMLGALVGCGEKKESNGLQGQEKTTSEARTEEAVQSGGKEQTKEKEQQKEEVLRKDTEQSAVSGPIYGVMPLILIETENAVGVANDEVYTKSKVSVTNCEETYELTGVTAGIRIRGNSTQMYAKKPYRIKFEEKQQVLGLSEGAHKSWVLLAEFNDPTLLRNLITYWFANALSGISYASDCALVEVYLDGVYEGVYLLAEQTQVDNYRIAIDEKGVADATITDTGYLLELEADSSRRREEGKEGEAWFAVTGYASEKENSMQMLTERKFDETAAYYVVKSDARSKEQMAYIKNYMIQVYDAVYQDKTKEAVEKLVDLESAVDMYLVQLIANDYDNNYSSMYLYKDAGGKLMFGAPWDFDLAYGNFAGYTEAEGTVYVYHLLRELGEYDWFREMAAERFVEISAGEDGLLARMKKNVTTLTEQYADEFDREYARWRENLVSMGGFGSRGDWELPEGNGGFGDFGAWGNWELPEGTESFGDFGAWGNWGLPEGTEGFGDFGAWGNQELPEGTEGFGDFGTWENWELPEGTEGFGDFGAWGNQELPEGNGGFGGFGDGNNFSYGAVYDTHEEAAAALLEWLDARIAWLNEFLQQETRKEKE